MRTRVELLVSEWCVTCPAAEAVWRTVATEKDIDYAVLDLAQPEGKRLARGLRIRSIPALVIDGELKAVGVLPLADARKMVAEAPDRPARAARHVGLLLGRDERLFALSALAWLLAAGATLLVSGSMLAPAPMHFFGGFVLCLIYALGAHMLPRFTGRPIRIGAWSLAQLVAADTGVALFAVGALFAGGALLWTSLLVFTLRLWPVLRPFGST
ncbi:MAG TPA: thioredoxin family protein [Burkholderiales bacterium]|nr:thioredoxin family protein [Burkholderiales bacterium]